MRLIAGLRSRRRTPEIMDQVGLESGAHHEALEALRRVNRLSTSLSVLWAEIRRYQESRASANIRTPVKVLDLATGGGDVPVRLWHLANRAGALIEFHGCDISPLAVGHARKHAAEAGAKVEFFVHDVVNDGVPTGFDVVISSLFLHHLDEDDAIRFLSSMRESGRLALVDDLRRGLLGWLLAYIGIRVLSRSHVARVDGPRSVEGAFTTSEAKNLAQRAGWNDFRVRTHWPCRFLLVGRSVHEPSPR